MTEKKPQPNPMNRREFISSMAMWTSLAAAYGVLGIQGLLYIFPESLVAATRKIFAGNVNQYKVGQVQTFHDLQGGEVLVRRSETGFQAYSNVCPHLGCRVHWEEENNRFFCPCHNGAFDENGVATAGPPKDGGQKLPAVNVSVDEDSGVVYLDVRDVSA